MRVFKKSIALCILFIIAVGVLSGCSRAGLLSFATNRDNDAFREMLDSAFAAIDSGDKEGLKNLFSVASIENNPDLESQIDEFFQVYKGPMEIENVKLLLYGAESTDSGKRRIELSGGGDDIIIKAGEVRYYVYMMMYSQDDNNKDNEGIHTLEFVTEDAYNSQYFMYHSEEDDGSGLYYQDSVEKRDDIKWIEGRPWKYTNFDRKLTADDLRVVVEKNDDFNNFVSVIGEPNCSWTVFGFYYYELENGMFAVCEVEDITSDIRPRVEGRVVRPDVIVAIYIADQEKNLETVWMADDIVKVLDKYHYFLPIDRVLTEDFFTLFASHSNSLSQLKEEIGLPNVEDTWLCYYKLSDNRYIECHYRGDNIEEFSVVDAEDRLYTIWKEETKEN